MSHRRPTPCRVRVCWLLARKAMRLLPSAEKAAAAARCVSDLLTVPLNAKRKRYLQELAGGIDEEPDAKKARTGPCAADACAKPGPGAASAPSATAVAAVPAEQVGRPSHWPKVLAQERVRCTDSCSGKHKVQHQCQLNLWLASTDVRRFQCRSQSTGLLTGWLALRAGQYKLAAAAVALHADAPAAARAAVCGRPVHRRPAPGA